jgi:hypothetical protein
MQGAAQSRFGQYCMCVCHCVQKFTFLWDLDLTFDNGVDAEAAVATLHSMAGRLTALNVPLANSELLSAIQQTGPTLSESLSSLSFDLHFGSPERDFCIAAQAVRGLAAGLQHVDLGLTVDFHHDQNWSAAEVQAADVAFEELMCSLPSCQRLSLDLGGCVSPEVEQWALLHHAPHLLFVYLEGGQGLPEQVDFVCMQYVAHQSPNIPVVFLDGLRLYLITRSQLNPVMH